jgi:ceramide glucosyltransferase
VLDRLLAGLAVFSILFSLASAASVWVFCRRRRLPAALGDKPLPAVTIMKPLKGEDHELYKNLASFCAQDYPEFQLLFCAASPEDPALAVVERLRRNFPRLDIELVVSGRQLGCNPKVSNLANAQGRIKHDLLMISDSDIRVQSDFLRRMVAPLRDPRVGMVNCFYRAVKPKGFWSILKTLAINAHFMPQAMTAGAFGMRFAMGAAMLVRRPVFEETGGFRNLADHIADDYMLGEAVQKAGYRLEFSDVVVDSVTETWGALELIRHQTREARTVRVCQPGGYLGTILLQGFTLLTIKAALLGGAASAAAWCASLWAVKAGATYAIFRMLGKIQNPWSLLLIPLSEWLAFSSWVLGFTSNQVLWRGVMYDIKPNGRLIPAGAGAGLEPAPVEN